MAEILLQPEEIEPGALPSECVVCGERGGTPVKTKVAVQTAENVFTKTLRFQDVWLPLCQRHQWHFQRRIILLLTFVAVFVGTLPVMGCYAFTIGALLQGTPFSWLFALAIVIGMIGTSVVLAVLAKYGNVEAGDITEQGVLLTNVSDKFVNAVVSARQASEK